MTEIILAAKGAKRLSWNAIAAAAGLSEVYTTSVCLGENALENEEARRVGETLNGKFLGYKKW